jgi:hypothetical protein
MTSIRPKMLQSLTNSLMRNRAPRPSGAYMHGPSSDSGATSQTMRRRSSPRPPAPARAQQPEMLKEALAAAMRERRYTDALNHILSLIALDSSDPRWPHKYGDVLRSLQRDHEAAAAYRRAARRYEAAGFPVRANAMLRLASELDGDNSPHRVESGPQLRADATVPFTEDQIEPLNRDS